MKLKLMATLHSDELENKKCSPVNNEVARDRIGDGRRASGIVT